MSSTLRGEASCQRSGSHSEAESTEGTVSATSTCSASITEAQPPPTHHTGGGEYMHHEWGGGGGARGGAPQRAGGGGGGGGSQGRDTTCLWGLDVSLLH